MGRIPPKNSVKGGFTGKDDPRRCVHPPGRPPIAKCIPDLLRWSGGLQAPNQFVEKIRKFFNLPENTMITVDQACILRSRMEAMNGDANHLKFWAERAEGKVTDKLELSGGAKLEIVEEIVDANKN